MTSHGRRSEGNKRAAARMAAALLAIAATLAVPASALAWDSPLEPVSPAADSSAPHGLGLTPDPHPAPATLAGVANLPASVDLTPWAPAAGDQGQVNSCAAWSSDYTAMGYYLNRQGIAGAPLAPMYTYSQVTHGQNAGTTIDSHLDIAASQGVDTLTDYAQGNYDYTHSPTAGQIANARQWKISGYQDLAVGTGTTTQVSIETALADGKPVVIGIPVYTNFDSVSAANHGFYSGVSGSFRGNHAVTALGYDSTGLRIENQWSPYWGENGFATLSWAFVNKYVFQATAVGQLVDPDPHRKVVAAPVISGTAKRGVSLSAST